jgi:hypothetical protein
MNESDGIATLRLKIWKLGNLRGEAERSRCPLCEELENHFIIVDSGLIVGTVK